MSTMSIDVDHVVDFDDVDDVDDVDNVDDDVDDVDVIERDPSLTSTSMSSM